MNWSLTPLAAKLLDWKQSRQLHNVLKLFLHSILRNLSKVISQLVITTTGKTGASGTPDPAKQLCFLVPLDRSNHAIIEDMPDVSVLVQNLLWLMTLLVVKPLDWRLSRQHCNVLKLFLRLTWRKLSPAMSKSVIILTARTAASGTKNTAEQLCFQVPSDKTNHAIIKDMPVVFALVNKQRNRRRSRRSDSWHQSQVKVATLHVSQLENVSKRNLYYKARRKLHLGPLQPV